MRRGPHPLSVQIGLAASAPGGPGQFVPQEESVASADMEAMLLGIQAYQNHPFKAERPALDTQWQAGSATLQSIPGQEAGERPVVLLVPSMVNKAYIFDLMPGRSLLRYLAAQGCAPYMLDWGDVIADEGQGTIEGIVLERLVPAIEYLAQKHGRKVHVLGYCMGGTLLAGAAQFAAPAIQSLVFLAAPWDFHAGTQNMLNRVKFWGPSAFPAIAEKGLLPMDWMQMLFASMAPASAARKFAAFAAMEQGSDEAKLFVAVEDWLNDGVDLPGPVAQQCIRDWFLLNTPATRQWMLRDVAVDVAAIKAPALLIASDKDRLVDYETAAALKAVPGSKTHNPGCGHIGMIAGAAAVENVWRAIAEWVQKNSP